MKLLRELKLKSMPDRHFGLIIAAGIASVQPYTILRNEIRLGRLQVFYPLPELMRITFLSLATWYEDAGKIRRTRGDPLALRKEPLTNPCFEKDFAHLCVQHALSIGLLQREPCIHCGTEPADGHHPDYRKPLWIIWLCHRHHSSHHAQLRALDCKTVG